MDALKLDENYIAVYALALPHPNLERRRQQLLTQLGFKFFQLLGGNDEMRSYRLNFGETEKNILKQMKPRIKKAKARFNS